MIVNNFCNLRYTYCYAGGEFVPSPSEMPLEIAEAAIDKVAVDAKEAGSDRFAISLIGGEPTMSFDVSRRIVDYAHRKADVEGLVCMPDIVTNGVFDEQRRSWIIENFEHVTISIR